MSKKYVYYFGGNKAAEGKADMKNLLGGKGANLAEMVNIGLPVPAGLTVTTECCTDYYGNNCALPSSLMTDVWEGMKKVENDMGMKYGDAENPLLLSCRSGARSSMPGMMDTVLNVGLCSATIPGLIKKTNNPRFVYDSYRRLIMMYADVVMEKAEGLDPAQGKGIRKILDEKLDEFKKSKGYSEDTQITADELKQLAEDFKAIVKSALGVAFPDDAAEQLEGGIKAVFKSWNGKKAISYRRIEGIPDEWGTAVNVQAMVFGNMGDSSATGVAFTRNPATGENLFYGEWLVNAQGEDVVAGIRTPSPLNDDTKNEQNKLLHSMQEAMPETYKELCAIRDTLETNFHDMLDIEFTIQEGKLFMLQCRAGKRTGTAALNMAMDMLAEGLINEQTAVMRVDPAQLDELLHPICNPVAEKKANVLVKGLPAGPGAAVGKIVFTAEDAVAWERKGETVILVREETNPEDVEGMRAAKGILTARGGMTSHAALVARGWGKCCIVGASDMHVDVVGKTAKIGSIILNEGDVITLNGTKGHVYMGAIELMDATENPRFQAFMAMADTFRTMGVRTNAETPEDAKIAREYGAEGIGLFRTEHMFYGVGSDEPLFLLRKMILSDGIDERVSALNELFVYVKKDIKATLLAMDTLPVTFRLLDPPLHEFVPQSAEKQAELAKALGITAEAIAKRGEALHESNPMMGHRGVRLGITYPEVSEMQIRAIFESALELIKEGHEPHPEIMVPVTCDVSELDFTKKIADKVYAEVCAKFGVESIDYKYGTMIEIPRACLLANKMAKTAEFFSFGTNDLTQMTFGFSRDDTGGFMNEYLDNKILTADPFQTIDQDGVGQLIEMAVTKGRATREALKVGICGEQGGDPASVEFCYKAGLTYVSCSPFRVPIARLSAAQSAIKASKK